MNKKENPPPYDNPGQPYNQNQPGFSQKSLSSQLSEGLNTFFDSLFSGISIAPGFNQNPGFSQPSYPQTSFSQVPQQAPNVPPIPSLRPYQNMSIHEAVNILRKSIMSFKADEVAIYNVLAHSTSQLRQHIKADYKRFSLNELATDLTSRFRQESHYFINGLLNTGAEFDAFILYKATQYGLDYEIVIHIFATRTHEVPIL
ncbi:Annexin A7 [Thelohanellus kitauei]|uniref:Annexin A7 n=1 Tax=Thelohanellus kitauei TaxID=669202 RepID=A0A0C2N5A2_THEKT|nr:Annexin A7 [Thelohanellus kitauei]